jgi:YVTN family beta-propeller protein
LPNGWRITPAGKAIGTMGDLVTNLVVSPDGRVVIGVTSGFQPHSLDLFDTKTHEQVQEIELPSTWLGMAWSSDGQRLYVSGGNRSGEGNVADPVAPIYEFTYANGRLSEKPAGKFVETIDPKLVWWSGVTYLPSRHWLYAANRGTGTGPSNLVVFDAQTHQIVTRIPVEVSPYEVVLTPDGTYLFVSNWSSESVSVIDTSTNQVIRTLNVGMNPNDMKLSSDGRLFVACSNDNTVYVIDTHTLQVSERLSTTLTPHAPEGSTPDALAIDNERKLVYIANADNNSIAVADIANRAHTAIVGFIPTGWYPSALVLTDHARTLYIGNTKGEEWHPDPKGPHSPLSSSTSRFPIGGGVFSLGEESVHTLQKSNLEVVPVADIKAKLPAWTHQVIANTPYNDSLLSEARTPAEPSVIPQQVGRSSPITHVIYIIKENRTYDQVFGDLSGANGDPRLTIFGEKATPNQHALVKQYAILDNLYCDGEVSVDGHSWSTAAYATDFNEKNWPPMYGGHSAASYNVRAVAPAAGSLWDDARRKGLTYRSYAENGARASQGAEAPPGTEGLVGHMAPGYTMGLKERDTDRVKIFLKDLKQYEQDYDNPDPEKQLPNYTVVWMGEDHTAGTTPGAYAPQAMVADNDYAIGQLVDAVSHSRYWPNTAIFIIEDDAQDGPDHVDARRTVGLVISPYVKRGIVDSTLYSTSSMLRSMELLLGLPPMSQYDAAAMPMYASFGATPDVTPFRAIEPLIDVNAKNTGQSYGAQQSSKMNFSEPDRAPMHALNEILWKSVKGADSVMPVPVHRFRPLVDASESGNQDDE